MFIIQVLVGIMVLTLGRQLFWMLIAGLGFIFGINYAAQYYVGQPEWVILVIGLAAGLIGALFAYFLQRFAVAVAGFLAGWYLSAGVLEILGLQLGLLSWVIIAVGSLLGLILVILLFDWSLILLSSLTGAMIVIRSINYSSQLENILFIFLVFLGIVIQVLWWQQEGGPEGGQ